MEGTFEIKEIEEVVKRTSYVVVENGEEHFSHHRSKKEAELEIELIQAVKKIKHFPYFKYFYYCKTFEEFIDYANVIGYQKPYFPWPSGDPEQDTHFIKEAKNIYHGPDWYRLKIGDSDGERGYSFETFGRIKEEYEKKIKEFEDALANPKTFDDTYRQRWAL